MVDSTIDGAVKKEATKGNPFEDCWPFHLAEGATDADKMRGITAAGFLLDNWRTFSWYGDDFLSVNTIGQYTSGSGAAVNASNGGDTSHPGCMALATGTTSSGAAQIVSGNSYALRTGGGRIMVMMIFKTPSALSDGTNRYCLMAGLNRSNMTETPGEFIGIRYKDSVNSGKWQAVARNGGTETAVDSGVTVAADTWYLALIDVNAGGTQVDVWINDVACPALTSNIPNAETPVAFDIIKSLGTTSREAIYDLYAWVNHFTTPR